MKRIYTFYKESNPGEKIAVLTLEETLASENGSIEILNRELVPMDIEMVYENSNNADGVKTVLESRVIQSNRMFFNDYCKEHNLCPSDINDRLALSKGRVYDDDYYIEMEESTDECNDVPFE